MQIPLSELVYYGFCDPGGSHKTVKNKGILARSAIVIIGVDPLLNRIFCVDTWADRTTTDKLIEKVLEKHQRWKPKIFGCEANAMQVHLANAINREARFKQIKAVLVPVNVPTKVDKEWRIESVLSPVITSGRLFVKPNDVELITEIRGFPTAQTKDLVDALASAIQLVPIKSKRRAASEEEESLARYLRNSGAPVDYIQQKMAELKANRRSDQLKELHGGRPQ